MPYFAMRPIRLVFPEFRALPSALVHSSMNSYLVLHCTLQPSGLPLRSANNRPASNRRPVMVQTVNTEADKAVDIARDATTKIMPAKQGLSVVPDVGKTTIGVSNIAGDFLAILSRNIEAYSRAQQIIINGSKTVLDKRVDVFTSTLWHAMTSAQEIMLERDLHVKMQKIFDVVRSNMQENTGNNNIIAEMNARSTAEAAQIVQSRTFEVLDEMQALFKKMLDASPVVSSGRAL